MNETSLSLLEEFKQIDSFDGTDVVRAAKELATIVQATESTTILDYGSGKGLGWFDHNLGEQIGINLSDVFIYDPAIDQFADLPPAGQTFDGVILFNVLQCCPEEEIEEIIELVASVATKFIHINVQTMSVRTFLPSGVNTNVLVRSKQWWKEKLGPYRLKHNHLRWRITIDVPA